VVLAASQATYAQGRQGAKEVTPLLRAATLAANGNKSMALVWNKKTLDENIFTLIGSHVRNLNVTI